MIANFLGELTLPAGVFGHEGSTSAGDAEWLTPPEKLEAGRI